MTWPCWSRPGTRPHGRRRRFWLRRRRPSCASTPPASRPRSGLTQAFPKIPRRGPRVLPPEAGVLAGLAASEAHALVATPVRALEGGNAAWLTAGHALTADEPRMADDAIDTWLKPYERA